MKFNESEMNFLKSLGENLKTFRTNKKLSQEELAFNAGLDRTYITGIENGKRNISIVTLKKLAEALSINVIQLLNGSAK